ncbi:MAG TPA: hypothetical protein VFY44_08565 [Thermoleophilaceae bacterium]|nr:hypothetical protein [Thermoleophilaceae bacterium]
MKLLVGLAGGLLLAMLAVLVAVLASLEGTRSELRTTRVGVTKAEQRSARLGEQVQPLLRAVEPLSAGGAQEELRRTGRAVSGAAGAVPPLAEDVHRGVGIATFIAQTLHSADLQPALAAVRSLTDTTVPAVDELRPALVALFAELDRPGARSLAECDRRLDARPLSAAGQVGCLLRTVPNVRGLLRDQRDLNARSLATQRSTLAHTRQIDQSFQESLVIQREILVRIRSLDKKTGGTAPPGLAP